MRQHLIFFAILLFSTGTFFGQSVHPGYIDGHLYLKYKQGTLREVERAQPRSVGMQYLPANFRKALADVKVVRITRPFAQAAGDENLTHILRIEFSALTKTDDLIRRLSALKETEYVEKVPYKSSEATPNDPSLGAHLAQINAYNAWNVYHGSSSVKVAIVDNAVAWTHPDLQANTYTNTGETPNNNVDDDGNGYVDDVNGYNVADYLPDPAPTTTLMYHGTHCAGIAGAVTDNSVGIAAIGWNIRIVPVQCEPDASTNYQGVTYGFEGIVYAVKAGAKIISCSWGGSAPSTTEQNVVNYAWNRGCMVIAAAGNSSTNTPHYPGAYNNVYCVASVSSSDLWSTFSNYGNWVDISAPGENINSTFPGSPGYQQLSGTSMATPLVAGLAAMMWSKSPQMTRQDILNCISATAVNIYSLSGNSSFVSGSQLGAGRIDAYQAMLCAASFSAAVPVANFYAYPRQTCVNTNINFYDSSLYVPAAWSWTFQGGSPATSTLSNPVVQYASTGVYSVGLMVSNGSGSNTIVKTSYITVTSPYTLPFIEGFQSTTFLPTGWTSKNIWNDPIYWQRATGVGGFGTSTACAAFNNYALFAPGERDEMLSPPINLSNAALARLRFDVAYARYDSYFSDSLEVKASGDCGLTWSTVYIKGGSTLATTSDQTSFFSPTSTQWRRDTVDISTLAGTQNGVIFSFINRGHYGQPIYVDNINIATPMPTINVSFTPTLCLGSSLVFTNTTTGVKGYTWTLPGSTSPVSTQSNPVVTYTATGLQTFTISAVNGASLATVTRTVMVYPAVSVTITGSNICSGTQVTLSPTGSGAATYSWYAGATFITSSANIAVSPTTTTVYSVTATNGSCSAASTTTVFVTTTPTVAVPSQTTCPGGTSTLQATGATSYTWSNGALTSSIVITPTASSIFTITGANGNCISSTTTTLTLGPSLSVSVNVAPVICNGMTVAAMGAGATNYTWSNGMTTTSIQVSPTVSTTYSVKGAAGTCTGSTTFSIGVVAPPAVTISATPNGSVCAGSSVTLTATGASSFVWNNGANTPSIVITPTASTVFSVTGSNNGCSDSKTVSVVVGSQTINVLITASAPTLCAGSSVTLTGSGANTYSWSTGATGSVLVISPASATNITLAGSINGCSGHDAIGLTVFALPATLLNFTNSACSNGCNGILNATTTGVGSFSYMLNGSPAGIPAIGLCPALYTLNTIDKNGCKSTNYFSVASSTSVLQAVVSTTQVSCGTCTDGAAQVQAVGGNPPYTYIWTPLSAISASSTSQLSAGCYTVTVVDEGGCSVANTFCLQDVTGIRNVDLTHLVQVYPNPATTLVRIDAPGEFAFDVINQLGAVVIQNGRGVDHATVYTGQLAKGMYLVSVKCGETLVTRRLVIQ